jgi:hypothetical protein
VHGENVWVLQSGGELDFTLEPLGSQGGGQLWVQHLQRDGAVVPEVLGEVHRCHTTASKLALDAVAVGEARSKLVVKVYCQGHALAGSKRSYHCGGSGATVQPGNSSAWPLPVSPPSLPPSTPFPDMGGPTLAAASVKAGNHLTNNGVQEGLGCVPRPHVDP